MISSTRIPAKNINRVFFEAVSFFVINFLIGRAFEARADWLMNIKARQSSLIVQLGQGILISVSCYYLKCN